MYGENFEQGQICQDCGLHFENANQLLNHKRRFCVNSGYDNLEGLAKIQFNGGSLTHQPTLGHKNYLHHYGANSLSKINQYDSLSASNLEKQLKGVNKIKRKAEGVRKYQYNPKIQPRLGTSKSSVLSQSKNHYILQQSQLDQELKRYQPPPKEEAISPPTFIDQLNMRNHTILDKSNSSLGRMGIKDRIQYAKVKLDQLNEIKDLYVKNGGSKPQFKTNVDRMIDFYKKFLKQNQQKQNGDILNNSQELIQSRVSTPILKLRELNEDQKPVSRRKAKQSVVKQPKMSNSKANQIQNINQPYNPYPYNQPVIMMPYAPPSQNPPTNDAMKFLEKMMQLKSEENKQLLEIMLEERRRPYQQQQPTIITLPQYSPAPQNSSLPLASNIAPQNKPLQRNKGIINVEDDYQFKKSMIDDLISQEKVLMALQQEELDQIKLLSQLPKDLQQIKVKSLIKASQTRHKVQKDILRQKMERLAFQEQNQTFEEARKVGNDRWAGEERKKLLENQMKQYVNSFQEQFNSDPNIPS